MGLFHDIVDTWVEKNTRSLESIGSNIEIELHRFPPRKLFVDKCTGTQRGRDERIAHKESKYMQGTTH